MLYSGNHADILPHAYNGDMIAITSSTALSLNSSLTSNLSPAAGGRLSAEQTLLQTRRPAPQVLATEQRIAIAKKLLLTPFGLNESHLARALNEIRAHQVDEADLYFQYTRSEGWSLEEGIVKTGSFSIDQGVGVRAVSGEKTAFAYSDDISEASLLDAARTVRSISAVAQAGRAQVATKKIASGRILVPRPGPDRHAGQRRQGRVAGARSEQLARAKDPRVAQVMAGLASEYDVVLVARADGTLAADVRPLVRLSVTVIAEQQGGRREMGSAGGGGRFGLAYFDDAQIEAIRRRGGARPR